MLRSIPNVPTLARGDPRQPKGSGGGDFRYTPDREESEDLPTKR